MHLIQSLACTILLLFHVWKPNYLDQRTRIFKKFAIFRANFFAVLGFKL